MWDKRRQDVAGEARDERAMKLSAQKLGYHSRWCNARIVSINERCSTFRVDERSPSQKWWRRLLVFES